MSEESNIKFICKNLWVLKENKKYTLYKSGITHSIGFLQFKTLNEAIENCKALSSRMDLVEKLINYKKGRK